MAWKSSDWNLDNKNKYKKICKFTVPNVFTWGKNDKNKRKYIRKIASKNFPNNIQNNIKKAKWWAFRIYVETNQKNIDIDNVPKLIIDAFSVKQINDDRSSYNVGLFPDDAIEYVKLVEVGGEYDSANNNFMKVEIFIRK